MICPPDHKHGKAGTCYGTHGCRCKECHDNARAYQDERRQWIEQGLWGDQFEPTDRAVAHIRKCQAFGLSMNAIAEASGVSIGTLSRTVSGPSTKVWVETADKICAVDPREVTPGQVPAWRALRRWEALMALGYSASWIAGQIGVNNTGITPLLQGRSKVMRRTFWVKLDALYRELESTPATADGDPLRARSISFTRTLAKRRGYVPPAAWDDIDDPDEQPSGARWRPSGDLDAARPVALPHEAVCPRCGSTFSAARGGRVCRDCRDVMEVAA